MEECRTYTLWNKTWPRDLFMRHPLPHYKTSTLSNKGAYEKPTWVIPLIHHWDFSGTPWEITGLGGWPALGDALEDVWGMLLLIQLVHYIKALLFNKCTTRHDPKTYSWGTHCHIIKYLLSVKDASEKHTWVIPLEHHWDSLGMPWGDSQALGDSWSLGTLGLRDPSLWDTWPWRTFGTEGHPGGCLRDACLYLACTVYTRSNHFCSTHVLFHKI